MAVAVDGAASDRVATTGDLVMDVPAPAGTGGLLVAFGVCLIARSITKPDAGWTERATLIGGTFEAWIWTKPDDAASSYAFTVDGGFAQASAAVVRLSGADGSSFVTASGHSQAGAGDGDRTTVECPGLTTAADGSLVLFCYGSSGGQSVASAPATVAEVLDITGTDASAVGCHLWIGSKTVATAGAEAQKTVTKSGFGHWTALTIAISPSGGGGGGVTVPRITMAYARLRNG